MNAANSLDVEAHDDATIVSVAGNGAGATGVAIGGALSMNSITTNVQVQIDGGNVSTPMITLLGETAAQISSVAVSGSGAVGVAGGGSDSSNMIGGMVLTGISGGAVVTTSAPLDLEADDNAAIVSVAGNGEGAVVSVGAAISTNTITPAVEAEIADAQVNAPSVTLDAEISSTITSVAVGGGGGVGVAAGGGLSQNNINPTIQAEIINSQVTAPTVSLLGETTAQIISIAAGGGGAVGATVYGADSTNSVGGTVAATITGGTIDASTSLGLRAHQGGKIFSVAGQGEGAVGASLGASISQNTITQVVQAEITGGQATAPTVTLQSQSDSTITSIAVGGGGAVGLAANGSYASNTVGGTLAASIGGGATVGAATSVSLTAQQDATILAAPINGAGAVGVSAVGSYTQNTVTTMMRAEISGSQVTAPVVGLDADSDASITSIAVGGGGATGVALAGSYASNNVGGTLLASIDGGATVTTSTSVDLEAHQDATITQLAGNGAGAVGVALAGAVADNTITSVVQTQVSGSDVSGPTVALVATSNAQVTSVAINGAGAVGLAPAASVVDNEIGSNITADIAGGSVVTGTNGVTVSAADTSNISAVAGAGAGAVGANAGVAETTDGIQDTVTAYVDDATVTSSAGSIAISADSTPSITSYAVAGDGALGLNGAGSIANATIAATTDAHISNGARLNASGSVSVQSQFTPSTNFLAGNLGGALFLGFGASEVQVGLSSNTDARATTGAVVVAGGTVMIGADSNANSLSATSVVGQGGIIALDAAIAHVTSSNNASATISSGAAIENATSVTVAAQTSSNPVAHAYGFVLGGVAAGGTSSMATESGTTSASVDGGIIGGGSGGQQVGALTVSATATTPVEAKSWAGGLSVIGATINSATASAQPTVQAGIDDGANVHTTGDVGVTSDAETGANSYVFAISIGGLTAGLSSSSANDSPTVSAGSVRRRHQCGGKHHGTGRTRCRGRGRSASHGGKPGDYARRLQRRVANRYLQRRRERLRRRGQHTGRRR